MIPVTSELLAKLLQDLLHLVLSEVSVTEVETLLVFELLSQLSGLAEVSDQLGTLTRLRNLNKILEQLLGVFELSNKLC